MALKGRKGHEKLAKTGGRDRASLFDVTNRFICEKSPVNLFSASLVAKLMIR